jgi:hypothetical protein
MCRRNPKCCPFSIYGLQYLRHNSDAREVIEAECGPIPRKATCKGEFSNLLELAQHASSKAPGATGARDWVAIDGGSGGDDDDDDEASAASTLHAQLAEWLQRTEDKDATIRRLGGQLHRAGNKLRAEKAARRHELQRALAQLDESQAELQLLRRQRKADEEASIDALQRQLDRVQVGPSAEDEAAEAQQQLHQQIAQLRSDVERRDGEARERDARLGALQDDLVRSQQELVDAKDELDDLQELSPQLLTTSRRLSTQVDALFLLAMVGLAADAERVGAALRSVRAKQHAELVEVPAVVRHFLETDATADQLSLAAMAMNVRVPLRPAAASRSLADWKRDVIRMLMACFPESA